MASSRPAPLDAEARLATLHLRRPEALARAIEEEIARHGDVPGTRLGTKAELRERCGVASTTVERGDPGARGPRHRARQARPGRRGIRGERSGWVALSQLVLDFKNSATSITEVLAVRDALETLIATDAALHHRTRDLRELRTLIDDMAAHVHDPSGYLRANWDFHRRAAGLCANGFARSLYEGLLDLAEANLAGVEARGDFDGSANLATHRELLEAIASRERDRVAAAVRRHNEASRRRISHRHGAGRRGSGRRAPARRAGAWRRRSPSACATPSPARR